MCQSELDKRIQGIMAYEKTEEFQRELTLALQEFKSSVAALSAILQIVGWPSHHFLAAPPHYGNEKLGFGDAYVAINADGTLVSQYDTLLPRFPDCSYGPVTITADIEHPDELRQFFAIVRGRFFRHEFPALIEVVKNLNRRIREVIVNPPAIAKVQLHV